MTDKSNTQYMPRGDILYIVTIDDLKQVIEKLLQIDEEEAKKYANIVMDFFGFHDRIIDNVLEQSDRQLFYALEAIGLLHTKREEITLHNGRQWRIHYWVLKKDNILQQGLLRKKSQDIQEPCSDTIYTHLSKDIWTSRKNTCS
jgi:hypothetical protein